MQNGALALNSDPQMSPSEAADNTKLLLSFIFVSPFFETKASLLKHLINTIRHTSPFVYSKIRKSTCVLPEANYIILKTKLRVLHVVQEFVSFSNKIFVKAFKSVDKSVRIFLISAPITLVTAAARFGSSTAQYLAPDFRPINRESFFRDFAKIGLSNSYSEGIFWKTNGLR